MNGTDKMQNKFELFADPACLDVCQNSDICCMLF